LTVKFLSFIFRHWHWWIHWIR